MDRQIFISHSRRDKHLISIFHSLFAAVNIRSVLFEFEDVSRHLPSWPYIVKSIEQSNAVFLILGTNLLYSPYTQNWVSFEVGIAACLKKDVWVFEDFNNIVSFPVPYLNYYYPFDEESLSNLSLDYERAKMCIDSYGKGGRSARPKGVRLKCGSCGIEFTLIPEAENFFCPSCRMQQMR